MLILAGVSINAIVGDNGVLTKTTYASFLSEMSAVEEAVQLWKAGEIIEAQGDEVKAIPANGLCNANDLTSAERLVGEVGYYRVWSLTSTKPTTDILSSADTFNSSFESELVFYPAGVQDLYYLNNEALEIKGNKTYLIDATTGMIFSMTGISLKGVRCYSLNMAKAVMNGSIEQPLFAEAEVSGTGSGEKLAGNVSTEYLMDENGNYILDESGNKIKNPDYNPNGFQIIADCTNDNIYKLYNNGDLYGKGKKGNLLNTPASEMESLDSTVWQEFVVPETIPGALTNEVEMISASGTMFIIDKNRDLWAWGDNSSNKLGLTTEEQIEYTGLVPTKININNMKVNKVFPGESQTFIVVYNSNNEYKLLAAGNNDNAKLGIGREGNPETFTEVTFNNPQNIMYITDCYGKDYFNMILDEDGKMYFAGNTLDKQGKIIFQNTDLEGTTVKNFVEIFNNVYGTAFENKIIQMYRYFNWNSTRIIIVDDKKNAYDFAASALMLLSENVENFYGRVSNGAFIKNNAGTLEMYGMTYMVGHNAFGAVCPLNQYELLNESLPFDLKDVKDIYLSYECVYYLMKDGKVYFTGHSSMSGNGDTTSRLGETVCLQEISNLPLIDHFIGVTNTAMSSTNIIMVGKDNKSYMTDNSSVLFGERILQKSWTIVARNVKKFKASTMNNSLAYIDKNNDIYILGDDTTMLGINSQTSSKIPNFELMKNYLTGMDIYDKIDGKVKDYWFVDTALFILTSENKLYTCGTYNTSGWRGTDYLGLPAGEDAYIPKEILSNVIYFEACGNARVAITKENDNQNVYMFGYKNGSLPLHTSYTPILETVVTSSGNLDSNNVYKSFLKGISCIFAKNGEKRTDMYVLDGLGASGYVNGFGSAKSVLTLLEMTEEIEMIDTPTPNQTYLILTKNKNVYGFGRKCNIGLGNDTYLQETPIKIDSLSNVSQLASGANWSVVVTEDGKVYGTGSNQYGILGRWIGIDRNTPNSRYKTAFEWVECPELEI